MKIRFEYILIGLLGLSPGCQKSEVPETPLPEVAEPVREIPEKINLVQDAEIQYSENDHSFHFQVNDRFYTITSSGAGSVSTKESKIFSFQLHIEEADYIDYVKYFLFEDDLVMLYNTASEDNAGGYILRFRNEDYSIKWQQTIPGFNIDAGPIEENAVYISAIGLVGKLDLFNGRWIWKHNQLYENNGSFSSFQKPILQGDSIIFREEDLIKKDIKSFVLNKHTGAPFR